MDHKYWEEQLQGYIDNELSPADRRAMEEYIEGCEESQANLTYFRAMKRRLNAHADSVRIPPVVEERLTERFAKMQRRKAWPMQSFGMVAAMAAALIIGFLSPRFFEDPYQFSDLVIEGQVVCHDCAIAEQAGLVRGVLCADGDHRMGIKTAGGELWRFANDTAGKLYAQGSELGMGFYGRQVRIHGDALAAERLLRIEKFVPLDGRQTPPRGP